MPITEETTHGCLFSSYVFSQTILIYQYQRYLTSLHSLFHVDGTVWIEYFFMVSKPWVHLKAGKTNPQERRHDCKLSDPTAIASDIQCPLKVRWLIPLWECSVQWCTPIWCLFSYLWCLLYGFPHSDSSQ